MKSPWTIAIEYDHLRPKNFVVYSREDQVLRPIKVGDRVFLYQSLPDQPVFGIQRKVLNMMLINDKEYRITFEEKRRPK